MIFTEEHIRTLDEYLNSIVRQVIEADNISPDIAHWFVTDIFDRDRFYNEALGIWSEDDEPGKLFDKLRVIENNEIIPYLKTLSPSAKSEATFLLIKWYDAQFVEGGAMDHALHTAYNFLSSLDTSEAEAFI